MSCVQAFRALPCLLLAAAVPAVAAGPATDPGTDVDTVVVTASRVPLPGPATPASVSLIDREAIDRRQAVFAADLLRDLPGVAVARSGSIGAQTQLRIRGAEANHLLVLIDGVEAGDPAGNDEFAFEQLTTADIESIELVRGPQSALWGSDALSGVVNIVTRQPGDELAGRAFAEGGAFGTGQVGGSIGGPVGGARLGFSASHFDTDGVNTSRSGGEKDGYRNSTGTLTASGSPTEQLALSAVARYTSASKEFDGISFLTSLPADDASRIDTGYGYFRAGGTLSLLENRWTQRLNATLTTTDTETRSQTGTAPDGSGGELPLFDVSETEADKVGLYYQSSLRLSGDTARGVGHTLIAAVDHERTGFRQRGTVQDFGAIFDPNQDQELTNTGVVVEYLGRPVEPLVVSIAVRRDINSEFEDFATGRIAAGWTFAGSGTHLRGGFATGQKAPTFIERFGFYPNQFLGNPDLKPESSQSWELGVDQPLLDRRLTVGITAFLANLEDEINGFVFDPGSGSFTARNLAGDSEREGVEASLSATPTDWLRLGASYTYTDSRQPDATTGALIREVRRPRNTGSLAAAFRLPVARAELNLNASYVGNRTDLFFDPVGFAQTTVRLDSYWLADVALSARVTDRLTVYGRVENLLDADYEDVFGFNTPGLGAYAGVRVGLGREARP